MPRDLLLEIGSEEIPAGFVTEAITEIAARGAAALDDARLGYESIAVFATPRRLTLSVAGVDDESPELAEEVIGPPAQVAFDADGNPTKAAIGFAGKNGVDVSELSRREVEGRKGEYVVCTRREPGRPAAEVLPERLTALIAELPWPKSMRWGDGVGPAYARPIHWIVCLLGDQVLPVRFGDIEAGAESRGHRFLAPEPAVVPSGRREYLMTLREKLVVADPEARATMIEAELRRLEGATGATVRPDPELVAEVVQLVEYPVGVAGTFAESFLEVPEEVIVSAMRGHQRYFAMQDKDGALTNRFATIAGTVVRDPAVVTAGNERVLAARLADAKFFWDEDKKTNLEALAAKLADVVYQKKLGSVADKVARIAALAGYLADQLGADRQHAMRAARLCKADLLSSVVYEFPDLQGVMGRYYAELGGEPAEVAAAIAEHYLPRGAGDELPPSITGAIVGIADRVDTVVGGFAAKLAPTGSADPFGLRRAALGVLSIILDRGWAVRLGDLVDRAAAGFEGVVDISDELRGEIHQFFLTRLRHLLSELPADCVDAALAAGAEDICDARARADALARLRQRADFEPLAAAFKRVANILKGEKRAGEPDPEVFVVDDERALWQSFSEIKDRATKHLEGGDYNQALTVLAELKAPVDRFFDKVLVIDKDERIRENRLALLGSINATFTRIADFRQLAV